MTGEPPASSSTGPPSGSAGEGRRQRVDAVRRAVDQALATTQDGLAGARSTGARAQSAVLEELGGALARMRATIDDLGTAGTVQAGALVDEVQQTVTRLTRPGDDARVDARIAALEARVAALETERDDRRG